MTSSVVWPEPPRWTREKLVRLLERRLKGKAQEAWLIGSHAARRAHAHSDVDLILVRDTNLPWPERAKPLLPLLAPFGAMDLLVYTPGEWRELSRSPTHFLREARKDWIPLRV